MLRPSALESFDDAFIAAVDVIDGSNRGIAFRLRCQRQV